MSFLVTYLPLLCAVASMAGTAIGVFVGMKVGLARLETWRVFVDEDMRQVKSKQSAHGDDLLIHDMEIERLARHSGMERIRRQTAR